MKDGLMMALKEIVENGKSDQIVQVNPVNKK